MSGLSSNLTGQKPQQEHCWSKSATLERAPTQPQDTTSTSADGQSDAWLACESSHLQQDPYGGSGPDLLRQPKVHLEDAGNQFRRST